MFSDLVGGILRCLKMAQEKIRCLRGLIRGIRLECNRSSFVDVGGSGIHKASVLHNDFANVLVLVTKSGGIVENRALVKTMAISWWLTSNDLAD